MENTKPIISKKIYEYATHLMVEEEKDAGFTQRALIFNGVDEETATTVVSFVEEQIKTAKKSKARRNIIVGSIAFVVGVLISVITYQIALDKGGTAVVAYGAIIFGGIKLTMGIVGYLSIDKPFDL